MISTFGKQMKKRVHPIPKEKLAKDYPIEGKLKDWYFKIVETSNGVWEVSGSDFYRRNVYKKGTDDPQVMLEECISDARKINDQIEQRKSGKN